MQQPSAENDIAAIAKGSYGRDTRDFAEQGLGGIMIGATIGFIAGVVFRQSTLATAVIGAVVGYIAFKAGKKDQ